MQSAVGHNRQDRKKRQSAGFLQGRSRSLGRDFPPQHAAAKIVGYHYGDENTAAPGSEYGSGYFVWLKRDGSLEMNVMESNAATGQVLFSTLAEDPDLAEIVEMFVDEMPDRIESILNCLQSEDWEGLAASVPSVEGSRRKLWFSLDHAVCGRSGGRRQANAAGRRDPQGGRRTGGDVPQRPSGNPGLTCHARNR